MFGSRELNDVNATTLSANLTAGTAKQGFYRVIADVTFTGAASPGTYIFIIPYQNRAPVSGVGAVVGGVKTSSKEPSLDNNSNKPPTLTIAPAAGQNVYGKDVGGTTTNSVSVSPKGYGPIQVWTRVNSAGQVDIVGFFPATGVQVTRN